MLAGDVGKRSGAEVARGRGRGSVLLEGASYPASDDGEAAEAMHSEEGEGPAELHPRAAHGALLRSKFVK